MLIATPAGAGLVVHDLAGDSTLPPLVISHATGFHGHCYQPIAEALSGQFHSWAIDHRGHGATAPLAGWEQAVAVDWRPFGVDALAVTRAMSPGGGVVGFGHSMGGAALLMAAHRDPDAFSALVVFEPIAGPFVEFGLTPEDMPLVAGARKRRPRFASYDEAYANYASKRPMSEMTPDSLRQYVDHGLRPTDGGGVELCCLPEYESRVFAGSLSNGVWELLPEIRVPTLVVCGAIEPELPSVSSAAIAERLPRGDLLQLPHHTHFGPFSHPNEVASLIRDRTGL